MDTAERIIASSPRSVADYKAGKTKAMGYLIGQVMKEMKGKADPAKVNGLVKKMLDS